MSSYVLTYFPIRGRAEPIRMMLKDQGKEWEEKVVTKEVWTQGTMQESCLFGQLPKFEDGELTLYQTNAIRRHIARQLGVYGTNEKEAALIDMMDDSVLDLINKYIRFIYEEYDTGKDKYLKQQQIDLGRFEKILSGNKGGFLVGDKISFADYALLSTLMNFQVFSATCLDTFPSLQDYCQRLSARPNLKAYFQSEAFKKRPIFFNRK